MNTPTIIWISVVAIVLLAFIYRLVEQLLSLYKPTVSRFHFFELVSEKEEFYCPGDEYYDLTDEDDEL